jgi:predicted short-subunit dehydrogenase-like oxidoreductase (DUF2520 family)
MQPSVSIIGMGNWGSSLVHAIKAAGIPLREVVVRRLPRVHRDDSNLPLTPFARAQLDAKVLWLCVPDSAIAQVTTRVVKRRGQRGLKGQIVVHSSGALTARVLDAAVQAGASAAAVHPMMTFPTPTPVTLEGVPFAIESAAPTRRLLRALVRRIGGRPFNIPSTGKTLYHLAGMFASPLLVSHLEAARSLAVQAGLSPAQASQVIEPIVRATVDNFFRRGGPDSFSGPIARGDAETIRLHLQALHPHPMLTGLYRSLAQHAMEALPASGRERLRTAFGRN